MDKSRDSGITTFKWDLPAGFRALTPLYPKPMVFPWPFSKFWIQEYVDIVIPIVIDDVVEKGEYVLNAEISWLVCKDICVQKSFYF